MENEVATLSFFFALNFYFLLLKFSCVCLILFLVKFTLQACGR